VILRAIAETRRAELLDERVSAVLIKTPLPYAVRGSLVRRWNRRKTTRAATGVGTEAEAFVVEVWSADQRSHPFTVSFLQQRAAEGLFQAPFTATSAYGRLVIPVATIAARVDLERPFLVQIEPVGDAEGRELVFGLCDFATFHGDLPPSIQRKTGPASALPAEKAKVVIWDLDETLWSGSLVEDGPAGITPRPDAVAVVKALDERGVLQSIASKNDAGEALAALQSIGIADYFLHPQIDWTPKSDSIRRLAAALSLGIESFIFIDDQPFERGEVQAAHPALRVLPHTAVPTLLDQPWLDLPVTAESRQRRTLYRTQAIREAALAESGTDYLGFLHSCEISLEVAPLLAADLDRIYELSQRTNQLNFTGAKLSRDAVSALATDSARTCLTLRCADRFGDYGVIGFVSLDVPMGEVTEFFLSCRVQRKRVEHAFFAMAAQKFRDFGHQTMRVRFRPTDRNAKAAEMLGDLGFTQDSDGLWSRSVAVPFADTDVVRVHGP
jgi:FkbH-like protein